MSLVGHKSLQAYCKMTLLIGDCPCICLCCLLFKIEHIQLYTVVQPVLSTMKEFETEGL